MYCRFLKAVFDRVLAFVLIIVFLPIMIVVSIFIYIAMGRPIFFRQVRPGKNERLFTIYKFRTMSDDKDSEGNFLPDELRLKGFGKLIRKLSLDELPQLFNVLKGDMSFIGPRPLLTEYLDIYSDRQKRRHDVKPGITGWAQINGRNAISWKKKFELDLWYVENISFMLDLKIFFLTFLKVLKQDDISSNTHITTEKFNGKN
jgi:undecaprenyl phosphate N,N'-diacetylbacillosamine 1-phosphate transferase